MLPPRARRFFRLAIHRPTLTEQDVDAEIGFHLEARVAQLVARGMSSNRANLNARRASRSVPPGTAPMLVYRLRRRKDENRL